MEIRSRWPVILTLLLGFGLRTFRLDFQPLWWDEGYSVYFASMSLPEMVEATSLDIHPPFYYALLHGWIALAGASPVALRLLSAITGTVTMPLFYFLSRFLVDESTATIATLLLAISPFHVYYSQEIRMYGLVTLLGLGATVALALILKRRPFLFPAYVILASLALYTQYYAVFVLMAHAAIILAFWMKGKSRPWIALWGLLVAFIFYLPWVFYAGEKLFLYVQGKKAIEQYLPLPFHYFLARHMAAFGMGHMPQKFFQVFWSGGAILSATALWGMWSLRNKPSALFIILVYLFVPLLGGFVLNLFFPFHPIYFERLLLIALPPYLLLLAAGIKAINLRLLLSVALAFMLASLTTFYLFPRYIQEDYRPLARIVSRFSSPQDVILCVYPWQIGYFLSYCPELCPKPVLVSSPEWGEEVRGQIENFWKEGKRIWFPAYQAKGAILESQVESYALKQAFLGLNKWFGTTRLLLFAPPATFTLHPVKVRFGRELELTGFALVNRETEPPGDIRIALRWEGALQTSLNFQLRLSDSIGRTWAQQDFRLGFPDRYAFFIPPGTPPGKYEIRLKVYDASTKKPLDVFDGQPPEPEPEFSIGYVVVNPPSVEVPAAKLDMAESFKEELGGVVRLLGYSLSSRSLSTGDTFSLDLFWQAMGNLSADYVVFVQLQDDTRQMVAGTESPPLYPTSSWSKGLLVRDLHTLVVPANLKPGVYNLVVGMYNPADGSRLITSRGDNQVLIAKVKVNPRPHNFEEPSPAFKAEATFGSLAELEGYNLEAVKPDGIRVAPAGGLLKIRGGWEVHLTLYWHPIGTTDKSYYVFAHLVDERGQDVAFGDSPPAGGQNPTTSWIPGEYITDHHIIVVPEGLPPGFYYLQVGLYLPPYGPRLPLVGGGDAFILPGIKLLLED